jgi:hypothetical protein
MTTAVRYGWAGTAIAIRKLLVSEEGEMRRIVHWVKSFFDPFVWSMVKDFNRLSDDDQKGILEFMRLRKQWAKAHPGQNLTADESASFLAEAKRPVIAQHSSLTLE